MALGARRTSAQTPSSSVPPLSVRDILCAFPSTDFDRIQNWLAHSMVESSYHE